MEGHGDVDAIYAQWRKDKETDLKNRRAERSNLLAISRWVTLTGLQAKPELNGLTGEIIKKDPSPGRVGVLVHLKNGSTKECALKPGNLSTFPDEQTVMAVRLAAQGECGTPAILETRVPRHLLTNEATCAVPRAAGIPLMVAKCKPYRVLRERSDYDNQWATWLMIEPVSGLAPPIWQSYVGPVLVYRDDGGAFSFDDKVMINSFLSDLLDRYGDGEGAVTHRHMTPYAFQKFKECHLEEMRNYGQPTPDLNI